MNLSPGETAILIIRRSDQEPEKYFLSVRRSESSFTPNNDLLLSGGQIPVEQFGEPQDFDSAFNKAVAAIRGLGPTNR